jgi:glycerophosphoryl diester phosphodiesterase
MNTLEQWVYVGKRRKKLQEPTQEEEGSDVESHSQAPLAPLYGTKKGSSLSNTFQVLQELEKAQGDLHKSLVDINLKPAQPQPHLFIEKLGTQINSANSLSRDNNTQVITGSVVPALAVYNDRQTKELNRSQLIVAQEDLGQNMKSIGKRTLQERHTSFFRLRQNSRVVTIKTINLESLGTSSTNVIGDPKAKIPYNLSK